MQTIHVGLPRKKPFLLDEPASVPEDLDWNMWLGPAPFRPYTPTITGPQNWRNMVDYSGGSLTDWGAHIVDTAQVGAGMDDSGPITVDTVQWGVLTMDRTTQEWECTDGSTCDPDDEDACTGCMTCVEVCPLDVMFEQKDSDVPAKCILCGECARTCPRDAIVLIENQNSEVA